MFPWVASRANMLYLAARTHNRAALYLHAARIAALREFWTDWLPWHGNAVLTTHPRPQVENRATCERDYAAGALFPTFS